MTTTPPLADVPIRSADDLTRRWTALLNPPVFSARSLWLSWLGADGCMLPVVVPVDDLPLVPEPALVMGLRQVHDSILEEQLGGHGHLAMALCRPGRPEITEDDDEWGGGASVCAGRRSDRRVMEPAPGRGRERCPTRRGAVVDLAAGLRGVCRRSPDPAADVCPVHSCETDGAPTCVLSRCA
jgi:hypothetical protein